MLFKIINNACVNLCVLCILYESTVPDLGSTLGST